MGIAVTDYTNSDAIRTAAGVSLVEWSDDHMANLQMDDQLLEVLDGWLTTHATIYSDGTAAGATTAQKRQLRLLRLYSQWWCAAQLVALWMAWPQDVEDGKNRMQRFTNLSLPALAERTAAKAASYRGVLDDLVTGTTPTRTWAQFGRVTPNFDPVAGS